MTDRFSKLSERLIWAGANSGEAETFGNDLRVAADILGWRASEVDQICVVIEQAASCGALRHDESRFLRDNAPFLDLIGSPEKWAITPAFKDTFGFTTRRFRYAASELFNGIVKSISGGDKP